MMNWFRLMRGAAALSLAVASLPAVAQDAPRIFSPAPVHDFGSQDNEGKVDHTFTIMNVGTGTLEISNVKSSCGCTVAELSKKSLAPGEETTVAASFNLAGKSGPQSKIISVSSNDPDVPVYKLELKGNAVAAIQVEPTFINYGNSVDDLLKQQTVKIKANKDDVTLNITSVEPSDPAFAAELKTITPGKEYEVVVSNTTALSPGIQQGVITIHTDDPKRPTITVRYHASVVGDLDIAPNQINLRFSEDGKPTQQYMRVAAGRVKEFKILEVVTPIDTMEAELIPRGNNNYNIRLGNMPTDTTLDGKELVIKTDVPTSAEIRIPFKVIKLQGLDGSATLQPNRPQLAPKVPEAPAAPAPAAQ